MILTPVTVDARLVGAVCDRSQFDGVLVVPASGLGGVQLLLQGDLGLLIERGKGLVHQENLGVVGERARHADALLHAAGELMGIGLREVREAGQLEKTRHRPLTHGGRDASGIDAVEWARRVVALGAGEILLTSMDRDGVKRGFDLGLTRSVADAVDVPVIASGGVGTLAHLVEGVTEGGADAVLAASIFHYGEFTVGEAKAAMAAAGIEVRLA